MSVTIGEEVIDHRRGASGSLPTPKAPGAAASAAFDAAAAPWREALDDLDEDVLAEAAAEARVFGIGPAAAVDELVRR
ncbi:hypothetical protein [Streptomyces sp. NPDC091287]|uniref:hypothetical protein n=1 Tax=Streptomyces sp. NPDC091287 TaxID=3365988 RepID=UPI00381D68A9